MLIIDIFLRLCGGAVILASVPVFIYIIKDDIKTFKEMKERGEI